MKKAPDPVDKMFAKYGGGDGKMDAAELRDFMLRSQRALHNEPCRSFATGTHAKLANDLRIA